MKRTALPILAAAALVQIPLAACSAVYLLPQADFAVAVQREVSAGEATVVLEHWLALDRLDDTRGLNVQAGDRSWLDVGATVDSVFGAQKTGKSALVAVEDDGNAVVPDVFRTAYVVPAPLDTLSASSTAASFAQRAAQIYPTVHSTSSFSPSPVADKLLDVFSVSNSASAQRFVQEFGALEAFVDGDASSDEPTFGSFSLSSLAALRAEHGANGELYTTAVQVVKAALSSLHAQNARLALLLTPPAPAGLGARQTSTLAQPPQQPLPPSLPPSHPIFSSGTCFASAGACTNATDACSGRGECQGVRRGGKECFVCACGRTTDGRGRRQTWAGDRCEKLDVSGPFVLIAGTVLVVALVAGASVALLAGVGSTELPSVLAGVSIPGKRD